MRIELSKESAQRIIQILPNTNSVVQLSDEEFFVDVSPVVTIALFHYAKRGETIEAALIRSLEQAEMPEKLEPLPPPTELVVESLARAIVEARQQKAQQVYICLVGATDKEWELMGAGSDYGAMKLAINILESTEPCDHIAIALQQLHAHIGEEAKAKEKLN